ncbi:hypothetical protein [Adhaeribacter aquaticus]|nr:hypothetical protein [Adhaeribacter aquaticus]
MKKIATLSSILVLGTLGYFVKVWVTPEDIQLNLLDEDIHLYL